MWTDKQKEAIDKRNSNILVAASAGSGKTAVLVERVITRVIEDNIDINKLLIVTFTNASASELKERLLKRIYEALDKDKSNAFLKRQIKNINIANIETIHSFCLKLIRSNFNILNIDPNVKICDESYSNILKQKAINSVLEDKYLKANKDNIESKKLYNLLELFSSKDENLVEYVLKIYSYINSFSYPFDTLKEKIEEYNVESFNIDLINTDFGKEIFESVLSNLKLLVKQGENILNKIAYDEEFSKIYNVIDTDITYIKSILSKSISWDELHYMLNNFSFQRIPPYKGINIELKDEVLQFRNKVLKKEIEELKKQIYEKSSSILEDNKRVYEYLYYLYDFIFKFDKKYTKLKQESSVIDFNDIEHLALKLLVKKGEDGKFILTQIAKEKRKEFAEVYTDEYQDTSLVQETILESISNGNNRFMVGDVKQSIYKFRQAMPEIFNEKYKTYEISDVYNKSSNVKILLNKNFRSRKIVIDSINEIFEKIMSDKVGDCNYLDSEKLEFGATLYKESDNNYKTKINIIDLKDDTNQDTKHDDEVTNYLKEIKNFEIEANLIAKEIKDIVLNFKTYDIKTDKFNTTKYKDIVILLRSIKDKGNILEKKLKENGVPAFCDVSSSIFESDEIKLVLSVLKIIDNPLQDIYMVSVMYSVIGKFSLDELLMIKNISNNKSIYNSIYIIRDILKENVNNLENEKISLLEKLNKFILFLEEYIKLSRIYTVSQVLLKLYKDTNIYNGYLLEKDTANLKRANLDYLIDIAINYENTFENSSISAYIKYVDNLSNKVDSSSSTAKILGENEDVVRIMTIHKSKGLEFPVVILCDTTRKYNIKDISDTIVMNNSLGIGINVVREDLNVTYPSVIKQAIKSKITKENKSEELRMLYVALTRAKEKLVIFATLKNYEKFKEKNNSNLDNTKVDYKLVEKNNDYFSNILLALNVTSNSKLEELFDINVIAKTDIKERIFLEKQEKLSNISIKESVKEILENVQLDKTKTQRITNMLKDNIDFKYKYLNETKTDLRVSVSKLKNEDKKEDISIFKVPDCIDNICMNTGAQYGTTIHTILMHVDYSKIDEKEYLEKLVENLINNNILKKENVTSSMLKKIEIFLTSKLANELKNSKEIYKEEEFILKDKSITNSQIQGIIDLYYINSKGNIILVDFKTDNLKEDIEFIDRYKIQLDIYKKAVEKLTKREVEHTYIYSFKLQKEIEV